MINHLLSLLMGGGLKPGARRPGAAPTSAPAGAGLPPSFLVMQPTYTKPKKPIVPKKPKVPGLPLSPRGGAY